MQTVKIRVLSPHRDDAAFSLGLAIERWTSAGHTVEVMNCFTKSRYSPFGDLAFVHANDLQSYVTALRHREDLLWSRKYHPAVSLMDLNLRDAPQRLQCSVEDVCSVPPKPDDRSAVKIRSALERTVKDALVLPLGVGEHVDHLTARIAAQDGWPETLPLAFYEDLPYSARPGMADGIEERAASLGSALQAGFVCEPADAKDAQERKRQLALCYDSQIDSEVMDQIADFCERYSGRERLWMSRAWRESGLGVWQ